MAVSVGLGYILAVSDLIVFTASSAVVTSVNYFGVSSEKINSTLIETMNYH